MLVAPMAPRLFRDAFECTLAVQDGSAPVARSELERFGTLIGEVASRDASQFQKALLAVAFDRFNNEQAFGCYLARAEALGDLLADPHTTARWVARGWARRSPTQPDAIAPVRFLLEAAAVCPLDDAAAGFDADAFEQTAQARATAAGPHR